MMEKVDYELDGATLDFTKKMLKIVMELELSEEKRTIEAKANCNYRIIEEFINLHGGYGTAYACGTLIDNYDLEFEDGVMVMFREYPKNGWESTYKIYISNDEDFIEKNRLLYDEDIDGYVLQENN